MTRKLSEDQKIAYWFKNRRTFDENEAWVKQHREVVIATDERDETI